MKTTKIGWAKNRRNIGSGAYTIIEVMIFLAVSGFMFVLAAVFINGKQDSVAFQQGMNAAGSTLTNAINSVANGEYPSLPSGWKCEAPQIGAPSFVGSVDDNGQGSSSGCVFMGEVLQFDSSGVGNSYKTYIVAGRQFASGADDATNLTPTQSFADAAPITAEKPGHFNLTETSLLEQGLAFSKAYRCDNGSCSGSNVHPIGGIGFFGSFGSYNSGSANTQASGAQDVAVVTLPTTSNMVTTIDDQLKDAKEDAGPTQPEVMGNGSYAVLCFTRGGNAGRVVVGGSSGQQTAVSVNLNKGAPCQS